MSKAAASNQHRSTLSLASGGLGLRDIAQVLREKAWIIVLCLLAALFAGFAYIRRTPATYRAQSVLRIDPTASNPADIRGMPEQDLRDQEVLQTIVLSFWSKPVLERVVKANRLQDDTEFMPLVGAPEERFARAAGALGGMINIQIRRGTRLIDVAVEHPSPAMAQKLANSLANEFIQNDAAQQQGSAQAGIQLLLAEADRLKEKVQQSELAVQRYKEEHNAASLEEKQDTVVAKLKSLSAELAGARSRRLQMKSDLADMERLKNRPEALLTIPSVANQPEITKLQRRISDYGIQISALRLRYTDKHPKMIEAKAELEKVKQTLLDTAQQMPLILKTAYETAVTNEQNFAAALAEQEKVALELNRQSIQFRVLTRDVETDQALYGSVLRRLKETSAAKGFELNNIRLFEAAGLPGAPVRPQKTRIVALSLCIGFIVGVGLCMGVHALDTSLRTVDQAEEATGLKVMGAIPRQRRVDMERDGLPVVGNRQSLVAEAFRSLRTALSVLSDAPNAPTTLFTSALSSEGKTFCSVNYAACLAQQGLRVLLIDADLRQPMLANVLLGRKAAFAGVAEFIRQERPIDLLIQPTEVPNLWLMPAGKGASDPAELLGHERLAQLIVHASTYVDRIVIDTPPLMLVSDTLLLAQYVDSVCLVVRAGKTPRSLVARCVQLLSEADMPPAGIVLNQLPPRAGTAGYYYYSVGKYGEDAVYGSNRHKRQQSAEPTTTDVVS